MRVLVEQILSEVKQSLEGLTLLWDERGDHCGKIGVHVLMGGANCGDWHLYPEEHAVLIGTQDMLLSRALNRGYASPRARWPMEFGLLNQDCLWVMDEVQLMDVGLATTGQLQAFREDDTDAGKTVRPCHTWWMSATMQGEWLEKSPETRKMAAALPTTEIPPDKRTGDLWDPDVVQKTCEVRLVESDKVLASLVGSEHLAAGGGATGPTLVVVNTVDRAIAVYEALKKDKKLRGTDLRLVHSRFRPAERSRWRAEFLNQKACSQATDRIIVATQVVEAGVNISAALLVTEIAPWANLVQRFGRCARWGGKGKVIVADIPAARAQKAIEKERKKAKPKAASTVRDKEESKAVIPYELDTVRTARQALRLLSENCKKTSEKTRADVTPYSLATFEENHHELLPRLYPYDPPHFLLRHELEELFDTTADLSGADIDISRFIRSGDERDLQVFWFDVPDKTPPSPDIRPTRDALCSVPFLKARDWLCGRETTSKKAPRLKKGMRAWVWNWLDGTWRWAERRDLYPGQTVLVAAQCGGYDQEKGWSPKSSKDVSPVVTSTQPLPEERADDAQDDESLSAAAWQTIATHGRLTAQIARAVSATLVPFLANLYYLAGCLHDAGKVFPAFQNSLKERPGRSDFAKAPKNAWLPVSKLYPMPGGGRRPGFRHELVSVLFLFDILRRNAPQHQALLGPWRDLLDRLGEHLVDDNRRDPSEPTSLEKEILGLDARSFNLLAYLVCAHHGKVRLAWHTTPADQEAETERPRLRGLEEGEVVPGVSLSDTNGQLSTLPSFQIDLGLAAAGLNPRTGPSWTERVLTLLDNHGPFTLAWLEALLRAADQRASKQSFSDPLLDQEVKS